MEMLVCVCVYVHWLAFVYVHWCVCVCAYVVCAAGLRVCLWFRVVRVAWERCVHVYGCGQGTTGFLTACLHNHVEVVRLLYGWAPQVVLTQATNDGINHVFCVGYVFRPWLRVRCVRSVFVCLWLRVYLWCVRLCVSVSLHSRSWCVFVSVN